MLCSHVVAYSDQVKGLGQMSLHTLITPGLYVVERAVGNQNVETQLSKLLCVVLTCGCIAYSDQVQGRGHLSCPHVHHPQPFFSGETSFVGVQHVETQLAKLLCIARTCGCIACADQVKGLGQMTPQPFPKGCE